MKFRAFLLFSCFFCAMAMGQDRPGFSLTPEQPAVGSDITVTYHPDAPGAVLKDQPEVTLEAFILRDEDGPLAVSKPMSKNGGAWTATFTLSDPKALLILYRFTAGKDKADDNDGNVWDSFVYKDGKPVNNAHLQRAAMLQQGGIYPFPKKRDLDAAKAEALAEKERDPRNLKTLFTLWNIQLRQSAAPETKKQIADDLNRFIDRAKDDKDQVESLVSLLNRLGDSSRAASITDEELKKHPTGVFAKSKRARALYAEKDPVKLEPLINQYFSDFSITDQSQMADFRSLLVSALVRNKQYAQADAKLKEFDLKNGNFYNSISWGLIEKGEQLEFAVPWAEKAVKYSRPLDMSAKPASMTEAQYKASHDNALSAALDTYGWGLYRKGDYDASEKAMKEAIDLAGDVDPDMTSHYVSAMLKNKNYDGVQTVSLAAAKSGKVNDEIIKAFREAYTAQKGSPEGFDKMLADARASMLAEMRTKIVAKRINKPSAPFALKGLDGAAVSLAEQAGKVVVIDFWATWCGPCKASFPFLQKVYMKYKDNPKVAYFAINTWDLRGKPFADKVTNAKKFMDDNKYTIPVLIDEVDKTAEDYDVEGIPTQFIIDRKGDVAFKNVGFDGPQIEDELAMMIDILLDESVGVR